MHLLLHAKISFFYLILNKRGVLRVLPASAVKGQRERAVNFACAAPQRPACYSAFRKFFMFLAAVLGDPERVRLCGYKTRR